MKLDVCLFTHNPRKGAFEHTLRGLARQTLSRDQFHVWVVDNGSTPPLGEADRIWSLTA
jgi:glycosyltransferase involved in cell wall biosynthesis